MDASPDPHTQQRDFSSPELPKSAVVSISAMEILMQPMPRSSFENKHLLSLAINAFRLCFLITYKLPLVWLETRANDNDNFRWISYATDSNPSIDNPWYSKDKRRAIKHRPTDGSNPCTTGATVPRDAVKVHRW